MTFRVISLSEAVTNEAADPYILIVKWDRLCAAMIERSAREAFANKKIVVCHRGADALALLRQRPAWLGVMGLTLPDIDGLDLLATIAHENAAKRIMVVSGRRDERVRSVLRRAGLDGYFDCGREDPRQLTAAVRKVGQGESYFSSGFGQPTTASRKEILDHVLTLTELQVFAVIGDGSDDQQAADRLGLSPNTVRTHRERIMSKLGLRTRSELGREAISRGVVRILPDGRVLRPGFELSLEVRNSRREKKPAAVSTT